MTNIPITSLAAAPKLIQLYEIRHKNLWHRSSRIISRFSHKTNNPHSSSRPLITIIFNLQHPQYSSKTSNKKHYKQRKHIKALKLCHRHFFHWNWCMMENRWIFIDITILHENSWKFVVNVGRTHGGWFPEFIRAKAFKFSIKEIFMLSLTFIWIKWDVRSCFLQNL